MQFSLISQAAGELYENSKFLNFLFIRFDPWSLLNGFKRKAISLGASYVTGEVIDFDYKMRAGDPLCGPNAVIIQGEDGKPQALEFSHCILAGGYESGKVASLAGIGSGEDLLSYPLPVEPR
jgi:FAD-dependent oxidoreductase domain-containing protein 1